MIGVSLWSNNELYDVHPNLIVRYYSGNILQQCENVTNPAKCLTATEIDTGVVAGRCFIFPRCQLQFLTCSCLDSLVKTTWLSGRTVEHLFL